MIIRSKIIEIYGWLGMGAIVAAYALTNFALLEIQGLSFQFLNIFGSLGILINAFYHKAYPSVVLNIIWAAVGIFVFLKMFF